MFLLEMLRDVNRIIKLFTTSKGVFGRVDFRKERKLFGKCLVGRGRKENDGGSWVFSL